MTTLRLEIDPIAIAVTVTDEKLVVELEDGRSIGTPLTEKAPNWGFFYLDWWIMLAGAGSCNNSDLLGLA